MIDDITLGYNMTTENYKVFYHVAKEGSISKAANMLYVSQPAVSKAIKVLEEEIGLPLFERTAKGVTMTTEGKVLFEHVTQAFTQLSEGERLLKQMKERSYGAVRIGISTTLCKYYFLPFLKAFHEAYPKLRIEIVNRTSPETMKLLEEGLIDCAIISDIQEEGGYKYAELMTIQDVFVSRRPPYSKLIPLKALENEPMLLLEKKNATRDFLDHFLGTNQVKLNVDIEISSMEFLVEFAKIGLGIACVIGDFIQDELSASNLYVWQTTPPIPRRSIGLMYKEKQGASLASQTFVSFMLDQRRGNGPNYAN